MRKLREITTRYSLLDLVEAIPTEIVDGECLPEPKPEGEKEFVKLHKTAKFSDPDRLRNPSFSGKVKESPYKKQSKDAGFPKEETSWSVDELGRFRQIDEGKYTYKTDGPKPKDKPEPKWVRKLMKMDFPYAKGGAKDKYAKGNYRPKGQPNEEIESAWDVDELGRFRRVDEGGPTKQHFKMAAETIKSLPASKRLEHAEKHAEWFEKSNPRFNRAKFFDAAEVYNKQGNYHEEAELDEARMERARGHAHSPFYGSVADSPARRGGTTASRVAKQAGPVRKPAPVSAPVRKPTAPVVGGGTKSSGPPPPISKPTAPVVGSGTKSSGPPHKTTSTPTKVATGVGPDSKVETDIKPKTIVGPSKVGGETVGTQTGGLTKLPGGSLPTLTFGKYDMGGTSNPGQGYITPPTTLTPVAPRNLTGAEMGNKIRDVAGPVGSGPKISTDVGPGSSVTASTPAERTTVTSPHTGDQLSINTKLGSRLKDAWNSSVRPSKRVAEETDIEYLADQMGRSIKEGHYEEEFADLYHNLKGHSNQKVRDHVQKAMEAFNTRDLDSSRHHINNAVTEANKSNIKENIEYLAREMSRVIKGNEPEFQLEDTEIDEGFKKRTPEDLDEAKKHSYWEGGNADKRNEGGIKPTPIKKPTRRGFVDKGALRYHPLGDTTEKQYRKSGQSYKEETEQLDEFKKRTPEEDLWAKRKYPGIGKKKTSERDKDTVLVSPKGYKGGGKVRRIPKDEYDPKKHSLAEEQLDESGAIAKAKGKAMLISRPKFDARGNVILTKRAEQDKTVGKKPRKLTGKNWNPSIRNFGEEKEQLDEIKKGLPDYMAAAVLDKKNAEEGLKTRKNIGLDAGALKKIADKRSRGLEQAATRMRGYFEVGKPVSVMIPGKGDDDPASGSYKMKRKKIYHGEETEQLDEKSVSQAQQKAAGAALATQRGESDIGKKGGAINRMALMKTSELRKLAKTKHKGLPERVKNEYPRIENDKEFKKRWPDKKRGK